jgi:hypothetical protein
LPPRCGTSSVTFFPRRSLRYSADRRVADRDGQQDLVGDVAVGRLVELREHRLDDLLVGQLEVVERVRDRADHRAVPDEQHLHLDRAALR